MVTIYLQIISEAFNFAQKKAKSPWGKYLLKAYIKEIFYLFTVIVAEFNIVFNLFFNIIFRQYTLYFTFRNNHFLRRWVLYCIDWNFSFYIEPFIIIKEMVYNNTINHVGHIYNTFFFLLLLLLFFHERIRVMELFVLESTFRGHLVPSPLL